ncbi:hypothetical protein RDWZM_009052 [Blomia tropicalis]|uniref:Uncharacterized protein n=1 Tax=Blomia tropicalis TaxID=40697 RepID=A0A9Q0M5U2_BLOTA|nr:hypothetical protein RDWZM_009052 [Blomia tropicalis]
MTPPPLSFRISSSSLKSNKSKSESDSSDDGKDNSKKSKIERREPYKRREHKQKLRVSRARINRPFKKYKRSSPKTIVSTEQNNKTESESNQSEASPNIPKNKVSLPTEQNTEIELESNKKFVKNEPTVNVPITRTSSPDHSPKVSETNVFMEQDNKTGSESNQSEISPNKPKNKVSLPTEQNTEIELESNKKIVKNGPIENVAIARTSSPDHSPKVSETNVSMEKDNKTETDSNQSETSPNIPKNKVSLPTEQNTEIKLESNKKLIKNEPTVNVPITKTKSPDHSPKVLGNNVPMKQDNKTESESNQSEASPNIPKNKVTLPTEQNIEIELKSNQKLLKNEPTANVPISRTRSPDQSPKVSETNVSSTTKPNDKRISSIPSVPRSKLSSLTEQKADTKPYSNKNKTTSNVPTSKPSSPTELDPEPNKKLEKNEANPIKPITTSRSPVYNIRRSSPKLSGIKTKSPYNKYTRVTSNVSTNNVSSSPKPIEVKPDSNKNETTPEVPINKVSSSPKPIEVKPDYNKNETTPDVPINKISSPSKPNEVKPESNKNETIPNVPKVKMLIEQFNKIEPESNKNEAMSNVPRVKVKTYVKKFNEYIRQSSPNVSKPKKRSPIIEGNKMVVDHNDKQLKDLKIKQSSPKLANNPSIKDAKLSKISESKNKILSLPPQNQEQKAESAPTSILNSKSINKEIKKESKTTPDSMDKEKVIRTNTFTTPSSKPKPEPIVTSNPMIKEENIDKKRSSPKISKIKVTSPNKGSKDQQTNIQDKRLSPKVSKTKTTIKQDKVETDPKSKLSSTSALKESKKFKALPLTSNKLESKPKTLKDLSLPNQTDKVKIVSKSMIDLKLRNKEKSKRNLLSSKSKPEIKVSNSLATNNKESDNKNSIDEKTINKQKLSSKVSKTKLTSPSKDSKYQHIKNISASSPKVSKTKIKTSIQQDKVKIDSKSKLNSISVIKDSPSKEFKANLSLISNKSKFTSKTNTLKILSLTKQIDKVKIVSKSMVDSKLSGKEKSKRNLPISKSLPETKISNNLAIKDKETDIKNKVDKIKNISKSMVDSKLSGKEKSKRNLPLSRSEPGIKISNKSVNKDKESDIKSKIDKTINKQNLSLKVSKTKLTSPVKKNSKLKFDSKINLNHNIKDKRLSPKLSKTKTKILSAIKKDDKFEKSTKCNKLNSTIDIKETSPKELKENIPLPSSKSELAPKINDSITTNGKQSKVSSKIVEASTTKKSSSKVSKTKEPSSVSKLKIDFKYKHSRNSQEKRPLSIVSEVKTKSLSLTAQDSKIKSVSTFMFDSTLNNKEKSSKGVKTNLSSKSKSTSKSILKSSRTDFKIKFDEKSNKKRPALEVSKTRVSSLVKFKLDQSSKHKETFPKSSKSCHVKNKDINDSKYIKTLPKISQIKSMSSSKQTNKFTPEIKIKEIKEKSTSKETNSIIDFKILSSNESSKDKEQTQNKSNIELPLPPPIKDNRKVIELIQDELKLKSTKKPNSIIDFEVLSSNELSSNDKKQKQIKPNIELSLPPSIKDNQEVIELVRNKSKLKSTKKTNSIIDFEILSSNEPSFKDKEQIHRQSNAESQSLTIKPEKFHDKPSSAKPKSSIELNFLSSNEPSFKNQMKTDQVPNLESPSLSKLSGNTFDNGQLSNLGNEKEITYIKRPAKIDTTDELIKKSSKSNSSLKLDWEKPFSNNEIDKSDQGIKSKMSSSFSNYKTALPFDSSKL